MTITIFDQQKNRISRLLIKKKKKKKEKKAKWQLLFSTFSGKFTHLHNLCEAHQCELKLHQKGPQTYFSQ